MRGGSAASVNLLVLPLMLLSGIMLPLTLAPDSAEHREVQPVHLRGGCVAGAGCWGF